MLQDKGVIPRPFDKLRVNSTEGPFVIRKGPLLHSGWLWCGYAVGSL